MARAVTRPAMIFRDPGRLVVASDPTSGVLISPYNWQPNPRAVTICSQVGEFHLESAFWGHGASRRRLLLGFVMPQFFTALGVPMALGTPLADVPPARPDRPLSWLPIVVSDSFWRAELHASPAVIGRRIHMDQQYPYTFMVVGVAPPGFDLPQEADAWVPEHLTSTSEIQIAQPPNFEQFAVCRLRPGISRQAAALAMRTWPRNLRDWNWSRNTALTPLAEFLGGDFFQVARSLRLMTLAFLGLSLGVVGGLYLRRFEERLAELQTRCLLGSGPARALRMPGIELAAVMLLVLPLAALVRLALLWSAGHILSLRGPWVLAVADWLVAAALAAALTILVLLPTACALVARLRANRQRRRWAGAGLRFSVQISCATIIIIAAALLLHASRRIAALPSGLTPGRVFAADVSLPLFYDDYVWAGLDSVPFHKRAAVIDVLSRQFRRRVGLDYARLVTRLREIPAVADAGAISVTPYSGYSTSTFEVFVTHSLPAGPPYRHGVGAHLVSLSAGAARTLGLRGEFGSPIEHIGAPGEVFVNQAMADQLGGDTAAMGQFVTQFGLGAPQRIVGVVGDVHETSIFTAPVPTVYYPFDYFGVSDADLVVRLRRGFSLADANTAIRSAAASTMPGVVDSPARAITAMIAAASRTTQFTARFLLWLGLLGLAAVALGAYSEAVAQVRRDSRELAIRLALGAAPARLALRLVLGRAAAILVAVAAGAAVAWSFSRVASSLYHGFNPGLAAFLLAAAAMVFFAVLVSGGALLHLLRREPRALLAQDASWH